MNWTDAQAWWRGTPCYLERCLMHETKLVLFFFLVDSFLHNRSIFLGFMNGDNVRQRLLGTLLAFRIVWSHDLDLQTTKTMSDTSM
jgi:hypothetical protein